MYVTKLKFKDVLENFYNQHTYDFMILFVSSFDKKDKSIIKGIIDNAKRIDSITGGNICFYYFIENQYDWMNQRITQNVKDYFKNNRVSSLLIRDKLYADGVEITMETANDICHSFGIYRTSLPAFILVTKNRYEKPSIFSVQNYEDLESFFTPLNILHSYISDKELIINQYRYERNKNVVSQEEVNKRNELRHIWQTQINRHERKLTKESSYGMTEQAEQRKLEIQALKNKLNNHPIIHVQGEDDSIVFPDKELEKIKNFTIDKLNKSLNISLGEELIELLDRKYTYAILKIWDLVKTRKARVGCIIEKIQNEINELGFDVFISCKSEDYKSAHGVFNYLKDNGFKPFIADTSIKEVGIEQYTALIGMVIDKCYRMIVYATDINYIETPYVAAEWHAFINDINTGHKPNAKILSILSPSISPHELPLWLRDKQSLTTESYKNELLNYLND